MSGCWKRKEKWKYAECYQSHYWTCELRFNALCTRLGKLCSWSKYWFLFSMINLRKYLYWNVPFHSILSWIFGINRKVLCTNVMFCLFLFVNLTILIFSLHINCSNHIYYGDFLFQKIDFDFDNIINITENS